MKNQKTKTYNSIIFDIGGVLLRWNPELFIQQLQATDPTIPPELALITKSETWLQFDLGLITEAEMINFFATKFSRKHLVRFFREARDHLAPIELGVELLDQIQKKGLDTYILSNMPAEFYEYLIKKHAFLNTVKGSLFSCHVNMMKPDHRFFLHLFEKYKIKPEKTLFIDDHEPNIESAKKLGIEAILCKDHQLVADTLKTKL